jgi:hypothetical protein
MEYWLNVLMTDIVISALPFAAHYSVHSKSHRNRILGIKVCYICALSYCIAFDNGNQFVDILVARLAN